jgi:type III secretion protein V
VSFVRRYANAILGAFVVATVALLVVPLPPIALDVLLSASLALPIVVLLAALSVRSGAELTTFPTVVLLGTLFRLTLTICASRLALASGDAGALVQAFGDFVVQGNFIVGVAVFALVTLVQFVVVTRGSERVAEVGARFTLDAMPGRQMSIDAEQRAGVISAHDATEARAKLRRESEFYGAMDGAMKFVKGDAIATIAIVLVVLAAGFVIGVFYGDLDAAAALETYGLLAIGVGLVAQIPALVLSTAAGLVVTRISPSGSVTEHGGLALDAGRQLFGRPAVLFVAAAFLVALALVPGLPAVPLAAIGIALGGIGLYLQRARRHRVEPRDRQRQPSAGSFSIEIDPAHAPLAAAVVEREERALADRVYEALGVVLPPIEVRPIGGTTRATVCVRERPYAEVAIDADLEQNLAAAIASVAIARADELLDLDRVDELVRRLGETHPAVVRETVPKKVDLPLLTAVLRLLVREGMSIRPLERVLDAIARASSKDPRELAERARRELGPGAARRKLAEGRLDVHVLDPLIEQAVVDAIRENAGETYLAMAPDLARDVATAVDAAGATTLLTSAKARPHLRELLAKRGLRVDVLSYAELDPDIEVRTIGTVTP